MRVVRVIIVVGLLLVTSPALAQDGFTQQDRDLLVELRVRLEEMDKRFEQIDKRFEDFQASIDKRLEESQASMDRRFEQVDKRFEQVHTQISDLRQDMNRRFEQMFHFFYILAGIFTSMVVGGHRLCLLGPSNHHPRSTAGSD